jgi:hypothetical protein
VFVLAFAVSGCGGSSSSGTTTSAATTSTSAGQNERMTQAQWSEYIAVRDHARDVNNKAIATFKTCQQLVLSSAPADKVNACLGNSTASVVTEGKATLAELDKLGPQLSGACAQAHEQLAGNVKLYVASVQAVDTSLKQNNLSSGNPSLENALHALEQTRASSAAFDAACKPTA